MHDEIYNDGRLKIYKKKDGSEIRVFDGFNDFDCRVNTFFLKELLSAFERMMENEEIYHGDTIHTGEYIKRFISGDISYCYVGNWIMKNRIRKIINVIKNNCSILIYDKEKILNDLDNFDVKRLKVLVDMIKRKGDTNETSRN